MSELTVLVVGATGSIGRHVVGESLRRGYRTRALVRDASRGDTLSPDAEIAVGDLTQAATLKDAVQGVDAVVVTHGSHGGAREAEQVDYGAVRNVLEALGPRAPRIALMTAIGVTNHTPTTGSAAANVSCAPAAFRTQSCAPAGSTTTSPTSSVS
jgi:uncharacterized protein YbjT (DUF2867 family)